MRSTQSPGAGSSKYSDADLLAAIETAAKMVDALGDVVHPLLARLEHEYHQRRGPGGGASSRGRHIEPRFLTDMDLRLHFGLSERALARLRATGRFPGKDGLVGKTDRKLVDAFFDRRAGLADLNASDWSSPDGKEHFE